jgi:hypothetical protein
MLHDPTSLLVPIGCSIGHAARELSRFSFRDEEVVMLQVRKR